MFYLNKADLILGPSVGHLPSHSVTCIRICSQPRHSSPTALDMHAITMKQPPNWESETKAVNMAKIVITVILVNIEIMSTFKG